MNKYIMSPNIMITKKHKFANVNDNVLEDDRHRTMVEKLSEKLDELSEIILNSIHSIKTEKR
jgi:hypothetical protein